MQYSEQKMTIKNYYLYGTESKNILQHPSAETTSKSLFAHACTYTLVLWESSGSESVHSCKWPNSSKSKRVISSAQQRASYNWQTHSNKKKCLWLIKLCLHQTASDVCALQPLKTHSHFYVQAQERFLSAVAVQALRWAKEKTCLSVYLWVIRQESS